MAPLELHEFCKVQYPRVLGSLTLFVGGADLAAELAQDVFVVVCRDFRERVSVMAPPGPWVHRVAINRATTWFRRRGAERRALLRIGGREPEPPASEEVLAVRTLVAVTAAGVVAAVSRDGPTSVTAGRTPSAPTIATSSPASTDTWVSAAGARQLRVSGGVAVTVSVATGNDERVSIQAPARVRDDVTVRVEAQTLIVERRSPSERSRARVEVRVQRRQLERIDANAGVSGDLGSVASSTPFAARLEAGVVLRGAITAPSVELTATAGADATLTGAADQLTVNGSSGALIDLEGLTVRTATVSLQSGAEASVTVTDRLDKVRARSGATLTHYGDPQVGTIDADRASTITRG